MVGLAGAGVTGNILVRIGKCTVGWELGKCVSGGGGGGGGGGSGGRVIEYGTFSGSVFDTIDTEFVVGPLNQRKKIISIRSIKYPFTLCWLLPTMLILVDVKYPLQFLSSYVVNLLKLLIKLYSLT